MSNDNKSLPRLDLTKQLGEELGKSIYKQLTINEKYTTYNFTYFETKDIIEQMYAKVYELLYKDKYGEGLGKNLHDEKTKQQQQEELKKI